MSIKMCPRVIYKRKKKNSEIKNSSPFESLSGFLSGFSGRESVLLWKHPSWMTNSLYGASVCRQGQSFFLVLKFRNQQKAVHSTVLCLSDTSGIGRVRVPRTGTDGSGSKRTRKTSPSSYAWKIKRNFPWMFANLNINGPTKKNMTTLLFHSLHNNNNNKKKSLQKKKPKQIGRCQIWAVS